MWFINDIKIKNIEPREAVILKLCSKNNIKVGNAWCKDRWLGWSISDEDYPILMSVLANER